MRRQPTGQVPLHKLARDACHSKRGTIHQAYQAGMNDPAGALDRTS